jgi:hypothetical protein
MFGWFTKRPAPALASVEEREALLKSQHSVFRAVDAAFHAYMEILSVNPKWDDPRLEQELCNRGIEPALAEDTVVFAPIAFGREVAKQLGVEYSDQYRLHSLTDGTYRDMPLTYEMAYAWARAMIGLYRTAERNELFKLVAIRSAELGAINKALKNGVPSDHLRESTIGPIIVNLRWRSNSRQAPSS